MKNLHITKPGSQNTQIYARAMLKGAGSAAPRTVTDGVDLRKGYTAMGTKESLNGPPARNHGK